MLTVCLAGRGHYILGDVPHRVEPGTVGLVLPDRPVGVLMADAEDPYDHYYCRFAGPFALDLARQAAPDSENPFAPSPHCRQLADLLERMTHTHDRDAVRPDRFQPADGILAEVLAVLTAPPVAARDRPTAREMLDYMHTRLAEPADLGVMAEHFGLSKSHLCRIARPLLGETIHRVWQEMKMRWARDLLSQSPLSVTEVARRVGFEDPFYFSRVFRKHTGMTPRSARNHPRD